jgi:hypothetical protein
MQSLERGLENALPLIPEVAPVCFCRSDARFANVIARRDGRVGLVDWEDSACATPPLSWYPQNGNHIPRKESRREASVAIDRPAWKAGVES